MANVRFRPKLLREEQLKVPSAVLGGLPPALKLIRLTPKLIADLRRRSAIELPEAMADRSLTSLQLKLIKIGARVVRLARVITFQVAEVAVTGAMVRAILAAIRRLRAPPPCA
jgi:hypothetical protein